ncbi:HD domain-containing phosphohydrolase [Peribacillus sp. SCS-155]|uniref:HD domain-containing phosphohydrolase n=1 Tax=Peribacillus sedimenti TaxID=3115297 RepID=UPI00390669E7
MANEKLISQLKNGDIITTDVYFNHTLLLKAGTVVNESIIQKLHSWGITKLNFVYSKMDPALLERDSFLENKKEKIFYSKELFDIKQLFYESLQYVVNEARYGVILNNNHQLRWLESLFISSLSDTRISTSLFSLKKADSYSYFHSFDVFLLGSLLADVSGIKDINSFAVGCLIHDIGKLKTKKALLQKEGKLSKSEFEEIQKHTIYGVQWLKENGFPASYEELTKSHHERIDGSGYPDGLKGDSISPEIRILSIVDTYSALTLKRTYKEPVPATIALELLLSKKNKFDLKYVINFLELLNIYPADSIVRLSTGKKARVKSVNENQPYRPLLEEIGTSKTFELPINFSVTIRRFIEWNEILDVDDDEQENAKKHDLNSFLDQLTNGNREETMNIFSAISEGMTLNNIFIDIIVKSIKEVETKWEEGRLSIGEEHDALLTIKDILEVTLTNMQDK